MKFAVVILMWILKDGKAQSESGIEIHTGDVSIPAGTEATISCTVTGIQQNLEYVNWRRSDGPELILDSTPGFSMDQGKFDDGSQVATLKISRDMNVEDTEYVCLVKPVNEEEMKGLVSVLISDSSSDPSSDSSSDSDWISVEIGTELDFDIEATPLEIKTNASLGTGRQLAVQYINKQGDQIGGVNLTFNTQLEVRISKCYKSVPLHEQTLTNVLGTVEKWWRLTVSSEGTTQTKLQLHCNEVEVMRVVLSDVKCTSGEGGVEGGSIEFLIGDSASELYRPYKPEWVEVQRELKMEHDLQRISIEVKMNTGIGDKTATVDIIFRDADNRYIGQFYFGFATPEYRVYSCDNSSFVNDFPPNGANGENMIKIIKSETEKGPTLAMYFNEVRVVYYQISDENNCDSNYYGDVTKIEFYEFDSGRKFYKTPRGSPCKEGTVCPCDPGFTGNYCQVQGESETDTTKPGDTDTDGTNEEERRKEGCSADQFECADKSACILSEWTCDGVRHCQDGSDESDTTCTDGRRRNPDMTCPPLSLPHNKSHLNYTTSTTCIYSCLYNNTFFPDMSRDMSRGLASAVTVTCDPGKYQWSHVTEDNPLGLFPTCREASTTSINKRIKWSSTYVPITESDEISCPDSNDEMIKIFENGFTEWETLHDRNITCEDGELEDGDFCFFVSDGAKCNVFQDSAGLNLIAIIGVRTTDSTSQDMEHFREVLAGNLTDTKFNVTVRGVVYKTYEASSPTFTVVETCEPGFIKIQSNDENYCIACDIGEYHNTNTDTCLPCPKDTTGLVTGVTICDACSGDSVTPRIGSRSHCISTSELCTVPQDEKGRRSPSPGTQVEVGTMVWTFCTEQGYSLVQANSPGQQCEVLDKTPQQCVYNKTGVKDCTTRNRTEKNVVYGDYNWPDTKPGTVAKLPCQYNSEQNARKSCSLSGVFQETDFSQCQSAVAEEFDKILMEADEVLPSTQDAISDNIKTTTQQSGDKMSSEDVKTTTEIIDRFLDADNLDVSETALNNLISTIDNVQTRTEVAEMQEKETSEKFRESAVKIVGEFAGKTNDVTFKSLQSVGFAVATPSTDEQSAQLILAGQTNVISGSKNEENPETITFFKAEVPTSTNQRATAVYYETDKSYPSSAISSTSTMSSFQTIAQKISHKSKQGDEAEGKISLVATIISDINIVDTEAEIVPLGAGQKVTMNFVVKDETEKKVHTYTRRKTSVSSVLTCKYYDVSKSDWSTEGCTTVNSGTAGSGETGVTCSCNHLSSFAVLMSFRAEENNIEELVSHILLGVSLFFLLLTLLAVLPNRKILKMKSVRINLMLVLANIVSIVCFFLMDLFTVEVETQASIGCSIIAFLLNYFWLCQLAWMIIEAATMYLALVKVFGTYISRAMLKYSVFGWAVPLVFPIIAVAWGGGNDFADSKTCFIKYPYGIASFYGPVVIGVMINWVLFVFIVRVILTASKTKAEKMGDSNVKMRTKQLQSALAVSTLLGLSWIIGFFLLVDNSNYSTINTVLRWLFILLNAPQGLFIFLFYVLLKEDMRKFWHQKIFKRKKIPGISSTGVDSKGQKTSGTDQTNTRQNALMLSTVMSNSRTSPHHTPLLPRQNPNLADNNSIKDDSETAEVAVGNSNPWEGTGSCTELIINTSVTDNSDNLEIEATVCNSDLKERSKAELVGDEVGEMEERVYCDPDEIVLVNPVTLDSYCHEEGSTSDLAELRDNEPSDSQNIVLENYTSTDLDGPEMSSESCADEVTYSELSENGTRVSEEDVEDGDSKIEDSDAEISQATENIEPDAEEEFPIDNNTTSHENVYVNVQQNTDLKSNEVPLSVTEEVDVLPPVAEEKDVISVLGGQDKTKQSGRNLKNTFALKVRMVQAVTAMLSRKAATDQPRKRRWISLRRANTCEVEEPEVEDSYKGPRLNKYGNFCEVTIMKEKDSTIERKLHAQLRKAESEIHELSTTEDEPEVVEVTIFGDEEETIDLETLENELNQHIQTIDL